MCCRSISSQFGIVSVALFTRLFVGFIGTIAIFTWSSRFPNGKIYHLLTLTHLVEITAQRSKHVNNQSAK